MAKDKKPDAIEAVLFGMGIFVGGILYEIFRLALKYSALHQNAPGHVFAQIDFGRQIFVGCFTAMAFYLYEHFRLKKDSGQ